MAELDMTPLAKLRIIWIAFFAAVCLYSVVPWFVIDDRLDSAAANTEAMRSGLQAGAIGAAVSSFLARRRWIKLIIASAEPGGSGDTWTRLQTGCIVTWAISEIVALVGVATALVTRQPAQGVPYALAALFLLYMHRVALWPIPPGAGESRA
jgi:hypothetical protein